MANETNSELRQVSTLTCSGCGCLCDDIPVPVPLESNPFPGVGCRRGAQWFDTWSVRVDHRVDGREVRLTEALAEAQAMLRRSRAPLIVGLDGLCTGSQQAAWKLADRMGAVIDVAIDESASAGLNALQRVGRVTATLGEVAQRSDLVIVWFSDPLTTHPRAWQRFIQPSTDSQRRVIVIDEQETESARRASQFIRLRRDQASASLTTIRALLGKCRIDEVAVQHQTGLQLEDWQQLLNQMLHSKYGAVLGSCPDGRQSPAELGGEAEQWARLIRALNDRTRFVSLLFRDDLNAQSGENVLAWSSGFGASVNLHRGYPRSCYAEYSAASVLADENCDLVLVASLAGVASGWQRLSLMAQRHFLKTPKIVLNELGLECGFQARVEICVARPGVFGSGDFSRMDDVSIPMPQVRTVTGLPGPAEILASLAE